MSRRIYQPLVARAYSENRPQDAQNLLGEWGADSEYAKACLKSIESRRLTERARRLYISLEEMPKPENQRFHYYAVGDMMVLHDVTFNALGKAVTAAEAARKQEFRSQIDLGVRAAAALVGVIGALIGLVSVLRKQ